MNAENQVRNEKIVTTYQSGLTLAQTGEKFGVTRERVRQLLVKSGVPSRSKRKPRQLCACGCGELVENLPCKYAHRKIRFTEADKVDFVRMYLEEGASTYDIAAKYKTKSQVIYYHLAKLHVTMRPAGFPTGKYKFVDRYKTGTRGKGIKGTKIVDKK